MIERESRSVSDFQNFCFPIVLNTISSFVWNLESQHVHVFLIHFFFKIHLSYKFTSPCPISAHFGYVVLIFHCPNRYSPVSFLFQNERNKRWYNAVHECNNIMFVYFARMLSVNLIDWTWKYSNQQLPSFQNMCKRSSMSQYLKILDS